MKFLWNTKTNKIIAFTFIAFGLIVFLISYNPSKEFILRKAVGMFPDSDDANLQYIKTLEDNKKSEKSSAIRRQFILSQQAKLPYEPLNVSHFDMRIATAQGTLINSHFSGMLNPQLILLTTHSFPISESQNEVYKTFNGGILTLPNHSPETIQAAVRVALESSVLKIGWLATSTQNILDIPYPQFVAPSVPELENAFLALQAIEQSHLYPKMAPETKLILDPGHVGNGSDGNFSFGISESELTFELAFRLQTECFSPNEVYLVRHSEPSLESRGATLRRRKNFLRSISPQPFLSLHFNASSKTYKSTNRTMLFVGPDESEENWWWALELISSMEPLGIPPVDNFPIMAPLMKKIEDGYYERNLALLDFPYPAPRGLFEVSYYDDVGENGRLKDTYLTPSGHTFRNRITEFVKSTCPALKLMTSRSSQ